MSSATVNNTEPNDSNTERTPNVEDKLVAAIYVVLPSLGLLVYILFFMAVLRSKELRNSGFFITSLSIAVNDIFSLLLLVFYAAPSTALQKSFISETVNFSLGAISNMGWFATSPTLLIQAVDRFVAIFYPLKLDTYFHRKRVLWYLVIVWSMGIILGIPEFFPCCYVMFWYDGYSWGYDINRDGALKISYFDLTYSNCLIAAVVVINIFVLLGIRRKNRNITISGQITNEVVKRREKKQFRLFFQFFTLVIIFVNFNVMFAVVPMLSTSKWMGFGISCALMLNFSMNGIIYVFFNETVNAEIYKLLGKRVANLTSSVGVLSTANARFSRKNESSVLHSAVVLNAT